MMKKVYICAPLGGDVAGNLENAKRYSEYALRCGAAPVTPHFYALCLDDSIPKEREMGIVAGLSLVVSWTVGPSLNAVLVNTMLDQAITMLDQAIAELPEGQHPFIHSDRGFHYCWPGWINRVGQAGLTRSISKEDCSPDNSACERFFGHLKMKYSISA